MSDPADLANRPVVIVSNRGPVSFLMDDHGNLQSRRGAGGLVSGIAPLVAGTGVTWIAAAMSEGDRLAAAQGTLEHDGMRVRLLDIDPAEYRMAYDVVSNATLWFCHHMLFDLARRPRIDRRFRDAWAAYRAMNGRFAAAVADEAPQSAVVLVQDYHLTLLAPMLREQRPDLQLVHFSHTPFGPPDAYRVLPADAREEMLAGMAAHGACGFNAERWAHAFQATVEEFLGETPTTFVSPLAPDPDGLAATAASAPCQAELERLDELLGDRLFLVRVDRIELSKNLLRGFLAFDELLDRYPDWRERVVFGAFIYPSREGLPEYLAYRQEVDSLVDRLNHKWATAGWQPIVCDTSDNYPTSVAALRRYDALLVNPIRDGLNLVAKEGPLVNERDGVLLLSTEAGAWAELGAVALQIDPFDVSGTADQIHRALSMSGPDRAAHASELRALARARVPRDWLADNVAAAQ